jgi:hypothetical protein
MVQQKVRNLPLVLGERGIPGVNQLLQITLPPVNDATGGHPDTYRIRTIRRVSRYDPAVSV